jgi:hypothetical protein
VLLRARAQLGEADAAAALATEAAQLRAPGLLVDLP